MDNNVKENTTYIFNFGNTGVGKSTLMASVANFIGNHPDVKLRMNVVYNQKGTSILLRDWLMKLNENKFPPITPVGHITQIDIGIQETNSSEIIPLTLLEMSGEDLRRIDLRQQSEDNSELKNDFQTLLKRSDLILLITSYDKAKEDDLLIHQFFEWMEYYQVNAPIALVITKWDLADVNLQVSDYVKAAMTYTSKFLINNTVGDAEIFEFSVGEVDTQGIKALNVNASAKIAEWILNCINN